jgi:hypothetical protein
MIIGTIISTIKRPRRMPNPAGIAADEADVGAPPCAFVAALPFDEADMR